MGPRELRKPRGPVEARGRTEPGGPKGGRLIFSPDEVSAAVGRLAAEIAGDYPGGELVLVGVLKGSFIFLADLARALGLAVEVDFIRAASYGHGTSSSGRVRITKDLELDVAGRDVLVVEDIVDTGLTLEAVVEHIRGKGPASLRVCALLDKPSRRTVELRLDYVGMQVRDAYVVGYGLDCAEKYRNLNGIYELTDPPG